ENRYSELENRYSELENRYSELENQYNRDQYNYTQKKEELYQSQKMLNHQIISFQKQDNSRSYHFKKFFSLLFSKKL
ncbi:MAG: hypothetical protein ACK5MJ_01900, partial [Alphaproteobacteria bacterium]